MLDLNVSQIHVALLVWPLLERLRHWIVLGIPLVGILQEPGHTTMTCPHRIAPEHGCAQVSC